MRFQISDLFFTDENPALLRGHCGSLRQDDEQAGETAPMQYLSGQAVGAEIRGGMGAMGRFLE